MLDRNGFHTGRETIPKLDGRRCAGADGGRIFVVVSGESKRSTEVSRRRRLVILGVAGLLGVVAFVLLALFQPWKLWVDDEVDEAAPVGAVPITAPVEATESSTPTQPSTAASPTTAPPATSAAPTATIAATSSPTTVVVPTTVPPTTFPPTTAQPTPVGGEFISLDHGTIGTVVLLQDASGTQFVRLENLDTSNGPDLFVYLSTNPPDGPEGQFDDDFVNLGRLEGNVGSSNYAIPAGTDLFRYASVVIWCDRFDSAFGAAPLM